MEVYNGEEILTYDEVDFMGDSLKITLGIFDSETGKFIGKDELEGVLSKIQPLITGFLSNIGQKAIQGLRHQTSNN